MGVDRGKRGAQQHLGMPRVGCLTAQGSLEGAEFAAGGCWECLMAKVHVLRVWGPRGGWGGRPVVQPGVVELTRCTSSVLKCRNVYCSRAHQRKHVRNCAQEV